MAWDDNKSAGDPINSDDWDAMVTDQKSHGSRHESGGSDEISVAGLSGQLVDKQLLEILGSGTSEGLFDTLNFADNLDVTVNGGQVDVAASGGLEFLDDVSQFMAYKKAFNSIRNRRDYVEYVLDNDEDRADEITNSQVLTHYIFEAENDAYDRFIDPNIALGMMAFSQGDEPNLTEIYEVALFFAPTSFYEGLMTIESVADTISSSQVLMDGVMEADPILRDQFGKEAEA